MAKHYETLREPRPLTPWEVADREERTRKHGECRKCFTPIAPRAGQLFMCGPFDECANYHAACVAEMLWEAGDTERQLRDVYPRVEPAIVARFAEVEEE